MQHSGLTFCPNTGAALTVTERRPRVGAAAHGSARFPGIDSELTGTTLEDAEYN